MSRRPFDPSELDQPSTDAERAIPELEDYVSSTATDAPRGLEERVMAAIEREPAPRRGFLAWLLMPPAAGGGLRQFTRATALAATLVLAVAGALFAGQLADIVRNVGSGSTPTPSVSPSPSESVAPSQSTSPEPTSSGSPEASGDASESPESSGSPDVGGGGSGGPSPVGTPDQSKTPRPSPSPTATETPEPGHT